MPELPEPLDFGFRRPRFLDTRPDDIAKQTVADVERQTQRMLDTIYSSYERASDKSNIVMNAAAAVAAKYTIPVPEEASEVVQAVNRQDPDSNNGRAISFDLFSRMLDKVEAMATKVDYNVFDNQVIADPAANARTIRKTLGTEFGGSDSDLLGLLMVAGHIMILFLMHEIQGMWRGLEKVSAAPKTAGPLPTEQGSPLGESILEIILGLATSFTITALNETLAAAFLDKGNDRHTAKSQVIEGAIGQARQVDLPPFIKTLQTAMGLDDHVTILKYCIKYISQTKERGYEFWWAYLISRRTRYLSARALSSAPMFSKKANAKLNLQYTTDDAKVQPDDIVLVPQLLGPAGAETSFIESLATDLVQGLNASVVNPTDEFLCMRDYESTEFEKGINWLAQVLDTRIARDVLCCLVRFLVNVDLETLKKIRAVLGIFINAQIVDLHGTMENFMSFLVNWVRETIVQMIMDLVQMILDKILRLVNEFLRDIAADLGHLEECPLIMELIQAIVDAVDLMLADIKEIVLNYVKSVELNLISSFGLEGVAERGHKPSGLLRVHKKRSIRRLLAIIDSIIGVIEEAVEVCDPEQADEFDAAGKKFITYDQILDSPALQDLEDYLDIPEDVKETYFADAIGVTLEDGSQIPPYDIGEYQILDPLTNQIQDCDIGFSQEIIQRILRVHNEKE